MIDVAIYEAVYNMMEGIVPEYDKCGMIREREGTRLTGIVPTGTYPCNDDKYIIIGGNSDSIFKRLMRAIGRPEMAYDPRFEHNNDRVQHVEEIEEAIAAWTRKRPIEEALHVLEEAEVPVGPIYSVADMIRDPHFQARGLFETVVLEDDTVKLPTLIPKMSETPGGTRWIGPPLGAHNREILSGMLGISEEQLKDLEAEGVI
jgi:crotonobetainyl-CoA:carnitine CoA-transferase CaiB-like acyl-CoA transferase